MKRWLFYTILILAVTNAAAQNYVVNGSFESVTNAALPDGWGNGHWGIKYADEIAGIERLRRDFAVDDTVMFNGKRSFRLSNNPVGRQQSLYSAWIKFPAFLYVPQGWCLSAWVKADRPATVSMEVVDRNNKRLVGQDFAVANEFRQIVLQIKALNQSPLAIRFRGPPGVTVWIDAVQLEKGMVPTSWQAAAGDAALPSQIPARSFNPAAITGAVVPDGPVALVDRRLYVAGQPFFPYAFNLHFIHDQSSMEYGRKHGFNTLICALRSLADADAAFANARKAGLRLIPYLACPDQEAFKIVAAFRRHPALLFWYVIDEPKEPLNRAVVERVTRIRELDPNHPLMVNYTLETIVAFTGRIATLPGDIISCDVYPVANLEWPGTVLDPAAALARMQSDKPAMFYLQMAGNAFMNYREPTPAEFEVMVYTSIIADAQGLFLFVNVPWNPQLFGTAGKIGMELQRLAPILASRESVPAINSSNRAVRYLIRRYQGQYYLLAVNTTPQPTECEFIISGIPDGQAELLGCSQFLPVTSGRVKVRFAGYQRQLLRLSSGVRP